MFKPSQTESLTQEVEAGQCRNPPPLVCTKTPWEIMKL